MCTAKLPDDDPVGIHLVRAHEPVESTVPRAPRKPSCPSGDSGRLRNAGASGAVVTAGNAADRDHAQVELQSNSLVIGARTALAQRRRPLCPRGLLEAVVSWPLGELFPRLAHDLPAIDTGLRLPDPEPI